MNIPWNLRGIEKVLNICEYALEQCLNMLEYMAEAEPKITLSLKTFIDTYRYSECWQTSKMA